MSSGSEIRVYDYVNHPYHEVRAALEKDAVAVFQSATNTAISRARSVASQLRVDLGILAIQTGIEIAITAIVEENSESLGSPLTRLQLELQAASAPALFPVMRGDLTLYPLTATETQLDFSGLYEPPLGILGKGVNAVVGYRVAEASVHRFINDVAAYLRRTIA